MNIKPLIRSLIRYLFGINGISLFVKKKKKAILQLFYTKIFSAEDLVTVMKKMGMKHGSVIFIHSSMTEFYNYTGTALELIQKILDVIGEEGTLLMPAYPPNKSQLIRKSFETNDVVFDVNKSPSGAGYLSEVFRTYPGVKRSINLQHSVCAYGRLADYFTSEHHLSEIAWDEYSPYFKLAKCDGFIFSFGLDSYLRNVTLIHCTETVLRNKYSYFASFFGEILTYNYIDYNKKIGTHTMILPIKGGIRSAKVIKRYFDHSKFIKFKLSNLHIEMVHSHYMFSRCIELAENGISIYSKPSCKEYCRDGRFLTIEEHELVQF